MSLCPHPDPGGTGWVRTSQSASGECPGGCSGRDRLKGEEGTARRWLLSPQGPPLSSLIFCSQLSSPKKGAGQQAARLARAGRDTSSQQYCMFQLVRNSTNGWEKAGVGFLHGSVAGCCSQANQSLSGPPVPISAPYPLPHKLGWTQFSVTSFTFLLLRTHAWPLGVLLSSTESADRRVRGSPGGRVPGRAQD